MSEPNLNSYQEVINYLYDRLPVFQRTGAAAYKTGLGNITALCRELDNPQDKIKTIHIAGTNGKGSVSHYLASILQCAGYKRVGLHTSPHLKDFRERIKIDGMPISEQDVGDFVNKYKVLIGSMDCSFFEVSTAMAFYHFAEKKCEIAIIETGLGGRLDSTNIINPLLSVITNISFDHVTFLGDTLPLIAGEKAGIIKPRTPVVIGESNQETEKVFLNKAIECDSVITIADKIYKAENVRNCEKGRKPVLCMDIFKNNILYLKDIESELIGMYQLKNIPTVLASVDVLNNIGITGNPELKRISESATRDGLQRVVTQTGLLGRWQVLCNSPLTVADTGHNEAGIREVVNQINRTKFEQLHFVFGMVNDKDTGGVMAQLPKNAHYYFCKANIPRALEVNTLAERASAFGLNGECFGSVKQALNAALKTANKNDLVFIGGSTFVVAEALEAF